MSRRRGKLNLVVLGMPLLAVSWSLPGCATRERSETIALSDAPAPVRATLEREAVGGQVFKLERETKGSEVGYEAEIVTSDGKWVEVELSPDGKVTERKQKKRGS